MKPFELVEKQQDRFQYAPIEKVIERVYMDYKFITEIRVSDVLEWMGVIYGILEVPRMFRMKVTGNNSFTPHIVITNYRGELPLDFRKVLIGGLRDADSKQVYRESLGTYTRFGNPITTNSVKANQVLDKLYNITGGYIFTEDETATLEMAYEAFPIDDRGFPLVPDLEKVIEYAKEFIAEKVTFNLFAANKISKDVWETVV
jgi:hypothetical protein